MDPSLAIKVDHVMKSFSVHGNNNSIKDLVVYHNRNKVKKSRVVLNDISFEVKKGEAIAIIGRNGSGKSTILKLLTGILQPNSGTITVDGKAASLIELGAGFHPDMTGRENMYINASIFGIPRKEVQRRYKDIVSFSGIEDYIDERIRNYSSGMYLRLAFSIAINVDADIMIIDEILAVGDMQFQQKCIDRLKEMKSKGMTIVLVTHSIDQAKMMCDRTIWIEGGVIRESGPSKDVCDHYREFMMNIEE